MEYLLLRNGEKIQIEPGSCLSDLMVVSESKEAMIEKWDLLHSENLSEAAIINDDGLVLGEYENLLLETETSVETAEGNILTVFTIRPKTELELLNEQVEKQQEETQMLTDCLLEMSEIVYG